MPTFDALARFLRGYDKLTDAEKGEFDIARRKFVAGLRSGHMLPGLRIKRVQASDDAYELTWASDGRATFAYGEPIREGERHVIWRRIGGHDILDEP